MGRAGGEEMEERGPGPILEPFVSHQMDFHSFKGEL